MGGILATVGCAIALLAAAPAAQAARSLAVIVAVPATVTVGQPAASALSISNVSTAPDDGATLGLGELTLVPSCGGSALGADCPPSFFDRGVLRPAAPAGGRAGSACAGVSFTITEIDTNQGKYEFTWPGTISLTPPGTPNDTCIVDYQTDVLRLPALDADVGAAGRQTSYTAFAADDNPEQVTAAGSATSTVTSTPAIAAQAAPQTIALGASFAATAALQPSSPSIGPTGTVRFDVYGPDDAACAGAPALTTTSALDATGTSATAAALAPPAPGTYRVVARYGGDATYNAAASACDAPAARVVVSPAPPPQEGPQIRSAAFAAPPRVGTVAELVITGFDPEQPISGVEVGFGEARGRVGESACRVPRLGAPTGAVTLRVPYTFRRSGVHRIRIALLSGDCTGRLVRTETTIEVTVEPARSARAATFGGGARAAQSQASTRCRDAELLPTATAAVQRRVAKAVLCLVNAERRKLRRKALRPSPALARAAKAHTSDMLRRKYFAHEHVPGGPTLRVRLRRARYRGATFAENLGYGSDHNAMLVVRAWMNSPGHRANILHPRLRFAGVGLLPALPVTPSRPGATYTMVFGGTLR